MTVAAAGGGAGVSIVEQEEEGVAGVAGVPWAAATSGDGDAPSLVEFLGNENAIKDLCACNLFGLKSPGSYFCGSRGAKICESRSRYLLRLLRHHSRRNPLRLGLRTRADWGCGPGLTGAAAAASFELHNCTTDQVTKSQLKLEFARQFFPILSSGDNFGAFVRVLLLPPPLLLLLSGLHRDSSLESYVCKWGRGEGNSEKVKIIGFLLSPIPKCPKSQLDGMKSGRESQ